MIIKRKGKTFTLTNNELREAYFEYQRYLDNLEKTNSYHENINEIKNSFFKIVNEIKIKTGPWYVELYNYDLDKIIDTVEYNVKNGCTWNKFWNWLNAYIKEMGIDDYSYIFVNSVEYEGDDEDEDN